MPRKTEIQAEETAVNSPLRRSTRKAHVSSPAPATVTTRRGSQTQNEAGPKTRRASLSQENSEKDEKVEHKPATRGRRASVTKEDPEPKPEPARTRSRRSSTASEPPVEEPKPQTTTRRRRSSAAEDTAVPEPVKPVKTRRNSATEKHTEEEPAKKTTRSRRGSAKEEEPEEPKEEPVKRATRSRRGSVDKAEDLEPKENKPATRGRRSSTEDIETEPQPKAIKLTPIKTKRRPSVSEISVILEPIEELDAEIKSRSSNSPVFTPVKSADVKGNPNLSVIDETSFAEEDKDRCEERVATPRRSPRINKRQSGEKSVSPKASPIEMDENQLNEDPNKKEESSEEKAQPSPKKLNFEEDGKELKEAESDKVNSEAESDMPKEEDEKEKKLVEEKVPENEEKLLEEKVQEREEKLVEQKVQEQEDKLLDEKVQEKEEKLLDEEVQEKEETFLEEKVQKKEENLLEEKVQEEEEKLEVKLQEELQKEGKLLEGLKDEEKLLEELKDEEKLFVEKAEKSVVAKTLTEAENCNISIGSDGSFKFHLNVSLSASQSESIAEKDDLNSSKSSNASDKENADANAVATPKKTPTEEKIQALNSLSNISNVNKNSLQGEVVVARVSNVFRPRMKENSFMEPMDVDEYPSMLDVDQTTLEDSNMGEKLAVSTPTAKKDSEDIQTQKANKSLRTENLADVDESVGDSFYLNLSQEIEDKSKNTPDSVSQDETPEKSSKDEDLTTVAEEDLKKQIDDQPETGDNETEESGEVVKVSLIAETSTEKNLEPSPKQHEEQDHAESKRKDKLETGEERRRSKSPSFISIKLDDNSDTDGAVSRKSKSPQQSLKYDSSFRRSNSPQASKQKSSRKSKSPQPEHSPKNKSISEEGTLLTPQSTKVSTKEGKSPRSVTSSPLPEENLPTEDINTSTEVDLYENISSPGLTPVTPESEKKEVDDVFSSENKTSQLEEEEVVLKKLKSPLLIAKDQTSEEANSPAASTNPLEEEANPSPKEENQNLEAQSSKPKSVFSPVESPSSENLRISDVEVEVRRRSKTPEPRDSPKPKETAAEDTEQAEETDNLNEETSKDLPKESDQDVTVATPSKQPENVDDYDFELPSDEEEVDKTHAPGYDESTVMTSYIATSQVVGDVSCSTELETTVVLNRKTDDPKGCTSEERALEIVMESDDQQTNIEITDTVETETVEEEDLQRNSEEKEIEDTQVPDTQQDNAEKEIDGDKDSENAKEPTEGFVDAVQDDKGKDQESTTCNEEEKINNSDMQSPQKKLRVRRYSLKKKMESYEEEMDEQKKSSEESESETRIPKTKTRSRKIVITERDMDNDDIPSDNDLKVKVIDVLKSPKKKSKSKHITENLSEEDSEDVPKQKSQKSKDFAREDSEEVLLEDDIEQASKQKKSRKSADYVEEDSEVIFKDDIKHSSKQKKSRKSKDFVKDSEEIPDDEIEFTPKLKKSRKADDFAIEETENIEDIKTNKKKKKKTSSPLKPSHPTSEEDHDVEKEIVSIEYEEQTETISFQGDEEKSKKNKSISPKKSKATKEKAAQASEENFNKSPSKILDDYITKKISEMKDNEESEDEDAEEPNEYICTMAEEGEEDTPSEDSNAIIDEGESIGSTESEYGSDDNEDYDEDDSFICDDEEEQLLSGEEYDLTNEKKKKKKSRIIPVDNCEGDIIKIKKKEKPKPVEKRSRIITLTDSSDSGEEKVEDDKAEEEMKTSEEVVCVEEKTDEEVFVVETKSETPGLDESMNTTASSGTQQHVEKRRLSSITIHENITVKEIKDSPLSERISNLVDSFCTTIRKGEISMNLSIECCAKDDESAEETEMIKGSKKRKLPRSSSVIEINESRDDDDSSLQEESDEETSHKAKKRLSMSMDNADLTEAKKRAKKKRRLSKSMDNLDQIETKTKKKKITKQKKKNVEKKVRSPKRGGVTQNELRMQSLGLISQLITDIRNRPKRTVRPSTNMNNSWLTEVAHVKPSTTAFDKEEKAAYKAGKVHPKDFRSQMLNDPSRVRRIDTKTLLKKRGVNL